MFVFLYWKKDIFKDSYDKTTRSGRDFMEDKAFFDRTLTVPAKKNGKLNGMTFAVKDVFAVKGHRNSAGNPTWFETHEKAESTSPIIERLLENGASLQGMTHTDELMYSLNGENIHYGTPLNPVNPDCIPGGSSSGSASAVANGLVNFAIGTDTGGSVRVPSAYCGLFGIRPTHGAISMEGVIPLAPSFDTVGWMAKDIETLEMVGEVLLPDSPSVELDELHIEETTWSLMESEDRELLKFAIPHDLDMGSINFQHFGISEWPQVFKYIQGIEAWRAHGQWIEKENPVFSPAIGGRFKDASLLDVAGYEDAKRQQAIMTENLDRVLLENVVLVIPTVASVAPIKQAPAESVEKIRAITMQMTCIAGLAGLPQVTVPIFRMDGMSLGLSFIANKYYDLPLLRFVRQYFGGVNNETGNN